MFEVKKAVLLIALLLPMAARAEEPAEVDAPHPVLAAVEWLPSFVNTRMLEGLETALGVEPIQRLCAYGQDDALSSFAATFTAAPPDILIVFGDHAARELRKACPDISMLAMLIRDAGTLQSIDAKASCAVMAADPAALEVAALATQLQAEAKVLAVIHTVDFAPNVELVKALETAAGGDLKIVPIHIAPGFCRTDSDFDLALRSRYKEEPFDLVYVPDDPNCSRFGTQIFRTTQDLNIPAIGTAGTIGKGCAVAFVWDFDKAAEQAAHACRQLLKGDVVTDVQPAPVQVEGDDETLTAFGLEWKPPLAG